MLFYFNLIDQIHKKMKIKLYGTLRIAEKGFKPKIIVCKQASHSEVCAWKISCFALINVVTGSISQRVRASANLGLVLGDIKNFRL